MKEQRTVMGTWNEIVKEANHLAGLLKDEKKSECEDEHEKKYECDWCGDKFFYGDLKDIFYGPDHFERRCETCIDENGKKKPLTDSQLYGV